MMCWNPRARPSAAPTQAAGGAQEQDEQADDLYDNASTEANGGAGNAQEQDGQTIYDTASNAKVVENEAFDQHGNDTSTA